MCAGSTDVGTLANPLIIVSINCHIAFNARVLSYHSCGDAVYLGLQSSAVEMFMEYATVPEVMHNYLFHMLVKLGCYVYCIVAEQYQLGRQQMERHRSYIVCKRENVWCICLTWDAGVQGQAVGCGMQDTK